MPTPVERIFHAIQGDTSCGGNSASKYGPHVLASHDGAGRQRGGVCTHQGCRLFFDQSDDRLRCPCHGASFSPTGQLLSHPGPTALAPLPRLEIRDVNGAIEVFGPAEPT
jgi:Rieske Fe-S protein